MSTPPDFPKAALWYAKNGLPVFPLRPGDKRPLAERGFLDATTAEKQIRRWWSEHPTANIGIPTGEPSGWDALDIDPRNGGEETLARFIEKHGALPPTLMQTTGGGGRHYLFRHALGVRCGVIGEGLDRKADGGYIVVPPSVTTGSYAWVGVRSAKALRDLPEAPVWLLNSVKPTAPAPTVTGGHIAEGERNATLTSLAGTMRKRGMSESAIAAALLEENKAKCNPPLPGSEVRAIAQSVSRYEHADPSRPQVGDKGLLTTRCLSDVEAKPVRWLWPGRIARGKLTIIAGNPGLGKSQITASIAAVVTRGGRWPVDGEQCKPGVVLFLSAEDDPADTLRPRLEAAGADLSRVHIVDGVIAGYAGDGSATNRSFSLQADVQALGSKLAKLGNVALVVIDPISAYLGDTDSHKNAEVRGLLTPLSELAAHYDTAIMGVSHLNKTAGMQALMRVTGSLAFVAAARSAYLVAADPQDKARRLFLPMKNNLGPDATGLAFRIEGATISSPGGPLGTSVISWEPEPVSMTADDVMQAEAAPSSNSALDTAADWLRETLADGPVGAIKLFSKAGAEGIAKKTLQRASDKLGVRKEKLGMEAGWSWSLPPKVAKTAEDAQLSNVATFDEFGHLREADGGIAEIEL